MMTKQRTRLSTSTLVSLAQVKLHLRDNSIRKGTAKERVARKFAAKKLEVEAAQAGSTEGNNADETSADEETEDTPSTEDNSFSSIAQKLMRMADDDEDTQSREAPTGTKIHLASLFDYTAAYWADSLEGSSTGLQEELEIYEMTEEEAVIAGQQETSSNVLEHELDY